MYPDFNLEIAWYSSDREDIAEAFDCVNEIVLEIGILFQFFVGALAGLELLLLLGREVLLLLKNTLFNILLT